ncbi:F-box protein [Aspergillus fijiensis CBS 313.89]|uniref:F-box domain-containing protein n=1 Tax=Aspergillus fijiensis CBS 313.89 TaxID=1448319 RepID=A0A8G1VV74_9EURO|nr:uncharacterized protein BO72DRAFT_252888 [Aspergillus fijiensis CBS 313.89]RAK72933.1 hypothetical protein BO72DRAFT_252888 [Aspergillus fijiensis CBS 313.89]
MATNLPVELIYCILDYLDVEDYIAARATCRKWRMAASTSSIIRNTLQQVPVSLPSRTDLLAKEDWNSYFCQIVRQNLLGCRNRVQRTQSRCELPPECSHCTIYDISRDGRKLVALKGARALLYSRSDADGPWELLRSSPLYSFWTSVCPAVLGTSQHTEHRIALSSDGQFLAVGLDKTIQVYSLLGDLDGLTSPAQHTVNQENRFLHPPPANYEETNGTIESLEFAEDDALLRVAIAQDTTAFQPTRVRYLGNPDRKPAGPTSLAYWRATINQVYLDSASMAGTLSPGDRDKVSLRGLQLLPRSYHQAPQRSSTAEDAAHPWRRYFTACLQSTTSRSNGYCIGQIDTSPTLPSSAQTIAILRFLPSRKNHPTMPQITPFTIPSDLPTPSPTTDPSKLTPTPQTNISRHKSTFQTTDSHHKTTTLHAATTARWNTANLPTAAPTTAAPLLAISPDASLMCLYEPGTGHYSSIAGGGAIYLYSLRNGDPPARLLQTQTTQPETAPQNPTPTPAPTPTSQLPNFPDPDPQIPTWSLLLDITDEDIQSIRITPLPPSDSKHQQHHHTQTQTEYSITATTSANSKQLLSWQI